MRTWYLSLHPQARRFGRTSSGSFGTIDSLWRTDPFVNDLYATFTPGIMQGAGGQWLHATDLPIDEEVWLEPEDVAEGRDTVVEAAIAWIEAG